MDAHNLSTAADHSKMQCPTRFAIEECRKTSGDQVMTNGSHVTFISDSSFALSLRSGSIFVAVNWFLSYPNILQ